jgi:signal transduction histidine kinase
MRCRPRSIRARDTLLASLAAGLLLGAVAVGVDQVIRGQVTHDYGADAERAGARVSSAYRDHRVGSDLAPDGRATLIQVVDSGGTVVAATPRARRREPLSTAIPPPNDRVRTWESCPHGDCMMINAIRVVPAPDSAVVYAAIPLPYMFSSHLLEGLIALVWLGLLGFTAWFAWWSVGRTLRPLRHVTARLADFSINDLSRRLPQPRGHDEIAQLIRTANATLDRLELAVEQQRRFSSDASHELRTPIAGLRAQLESALMYPDDTDLFATLKSALRDTDRLEAVVSDLLFLAQLGTDHKIATELIDLGQMVAGELEERAGRAVIGADIQPGVEVEGVRVQLLRLLVNLLDNAERYGEGVIDVAVFAEEGDAVLMVTDSGPGIPHQDRDRVFERFTRLDTARSRSAGGTGLGLAIARDIARAHGGSLQIADSPTGARFVLRLRAYGGASDTTAGDAFDERPDG